MGVPLLVVLDTFVERSGQMKVSANVIVVCQPTRILGLEHIVVAVTSRIAYAAGAAIADALQPRDRADKVEVVRLSSHPHHP